MIIYRESGTNMVNPHDVEKLKLTFIKHTTLYKQRLNDFGELNIKQRMISFSIGRYSGNVFL